RSEQVLGAPIPQRKILDDQGERERAQELEQLRRPVKAPQQRYLGGGAEGADRDPGGGRAPPEAQASRKAVRRVAPPHAQSAAREVQDARYAEDERYPRRDEKQRRGARQPVEELDEQRGHAIPAVGASSPVRPPAGTSRRPRNSTRSSRLCRPSSRCGRRRRPWSTGGRARGRLSDRRAYRPGDPSSPRRASRCRRSRPFGSRRRRT